MSLGSLSRPLSLNRLNAARQRILCTRYSFKPSYPVRPITCTTKLYDEDQRRPRTAETALNTSNDHRGAFSRTDNRVRIEHPEDHEHPEESHYKGKGGHHFKRTLPTFTLDGRSVVITGGARGLGLVMSQACLLSGANVALVDLNSKPQRPCH